jgi:hypothetical protein
LVVWFTHHRADQGERTDAGRGLEQIAAGCAGILVAARPVIGFTCAMLFDLIAAVGPCGRVTLAPAARTPPQVVVSSA